MSENKTILTTRRFELWWRKAQAWFATQFASINVDFTPVEEKVDEVKEAVENIHVDSESADMVKDFFHIVKDGDTVKVITEDGGEEVVVPVELATEQEVKDINNDVMGALYGYGKVTVTIHSLMRTGAETTQDLASVIYVDPEKTWAENGYPTLYDDEGEPIDTTTNPAAGDEVFNYQIQSES